MEVVQIDSPTFHEEIMARDVFNRLTETGLMPYIDKEGNVLASLPGDTSRETFVINAHLDTVQRVDGASVEPFIDNDGWIKSRGETILGADNKTAVAAILETVSKLAREKNKTNHPLEIVFTVSEESGNHGAHGLDYSRLNVKRGFCFDAGGRDFGDMIISSPAYNRFDMEIIGKAAHASVPEEANNVLPIFAKALLNTPIGRISQHTTANIGVVSVGEIGGPVNTIPGKIIVSGEIRSMNEDELALVTKSIKLAFAKEVKSSGAKQKFIVKRENGSFEFKPEDSFIVRTLDAVKNLGINNPKLVKSWGCYEANIFAEHGIMMLNIADGSLDNHAETERIKVTDLERLQELVYKLVTE